MWIGIDVDKESASSWKEIVVLFLLVLGVSVLSILISLGIYWLVMLGLGIRLSGFEAFVSWLVVYLLPGIEKWFRRKGGE